MTEEDRIRQVIVDKASELFFEYGFTNTTTQQIAEELDISKKTIYKYFPSKEALLEEILAKEHREMEFRLSNLVNDTSLDFVEKGKRLSELLVMGDSKFGPQFIRDLQKMNFKESCHPQGRQRILDYIEQLVREGIEEGLIRKDVNVTLVLLLVEGIHANLTFKQIAEIGLSMTETLEGLIQILNEGILSEQGREKYVKQEAAMFRKYF
jgi:AcrR family transcriptional regulator